MTDTIKAKLHKKKITLSRLELLSNLSLCEPILFEDILFDFSKNFLDPETLKLLVTWAETKKLQEHITRLYEGFPVNQSEQRAALHMALRGGCASHLELVQAELHKMRMMVDAIRHHTLLGFTGKPIETIVNLGVGGSHSGVALCLDALYDDGNSDLKIHCVSALGGLHLKRLLKALSPETTLFIVASKSFTTMDTLTNANTVQSWFLEKTGRADIWPRHFIGISANQTAMQSYGILPERQFYVWDWVGGRYSVSSAIGLPIAIAIGMPQFLQFLEGMRLVDYHFLEMPLLKNIPVIMGLLSVWYVNFWGAEAHAILPYDERLQKLPSYLTQLWVESLGKSVEQNGEPVEGHTSPVVFGDLGTDAQHSFFQMLHQGTRFVTTDFIAVAQGASPHNHHALVLANCLGQTRALALGNRPSNTFLLSSLTPKTLGSLIAFYEHSVFVQSVLWGINPFDQWGVELGKKTAKTLINYIGKETTGFDFSTNQLLNYLARTLKTE